MITQEVHRGPRGIRKWIGVKEPEVRTDQELREIARDLKRTELTLRMMNKYSEIDLIRLCLAWLQSYQLNATDHRRLMRTYKEMKAKGELNEHEIRTAGL